jgi:hypothetical protein
MKLDRIELHSSGKRQIVKERDRMKIIRALLLSGVTVAGLCAPLDALADGTTVPPPVVVPHGDKDLSRDLRGVPDNIKGLIISFDSVRDKYLAGQKLLLAKLKNATTKEEREQIRQQLQQNRQAFLDALKDFRDQLKDDLVALKGKISHGEFDRILDAARDVSHEGGVRHHRGH